MNKEKQVTPRLQGRYRSLVRKHMKLLKDTDNDKDSGMRSLARALGLGHATLWRRLKMPETIKIEHVYAMEHYNQMVSK